MVVHKDCRRDYIHPRNANSKIKCKENVPQRLLRSENKECFDFKCKCILCGSDAKFTKGKRGPDVFPVRSLDFQKVILKHCDERQDAWSDDVRARLLSVIDLPAAEAVYHQTCSVNFRTKKNLPRFTGHFSNTSVKLKSPGRPENTEQINAFSKLVDYVKSNDDKLITVSQLVAMMADLCGEKAYSIKHMKQKLLDHFGDSIVIGSVEGHSDVITLKENASTIIHEFHKRQQSSNDEEEKAKIISTAAKLIKSDIVSMSTPTDMYPSISDVSSTDKNLSLLPTSLRLLLSAIFCGKDVKVASIGQAILQACKPKSIIAPLQLALGIQVHHHFGSRYLVDLLNALGFSVSYHEVNKFECNAASTLNTNIPITDTGDALLQFVSDNVDHNLCTIDGNGTFHGMGTIAITTPGTDMPISIPRLNISADEVTALGKINIKYYIKPTEGLSCETNFLPLPQYSSSTISQSPLDLLYKIIWPMRPKRPLWSGFMQMYSTSVSDYPTKATVTFMPMIDLSPSDLSCIYSTLYFVCDQAQRYGVTPVITFDQPLFQKACMIVDQELPESPLKKLVIRLGGFHTEMSFLGCIGRLMSGSGLEEVFSTVYAQNAVGHMMTGKAVLRAVRAHNLVDTALHVLLLEDAFGVDFGIGENEQQTNTATGSVSAHEPISEPILSLSFLYDELCKEEATHDIIKESSSLKITKQKLEQYIVKHNENRTATLWLQYLEMVNILQEFIKAERTGDWNQHLQSIRNMLPYFAAAGHNLYLKSAYLYLQNMQRLGDDHPDIERAFQAGKHTVRRKDKYWAGLSTDLVIEQALMRSIKSNGGLTRGRGMNEHQRSLWLMSRPACVGMNNAIQEFSNTIYTTSDQHKDTSVARVNKDKSDTEILYTFLKNRNPFQATDCLRNIETGMSAEQNVNVDRAKVVGEKILSEMEGIPIDRYTFKRSTQVVTMSDRSAIKSNGEKFSLDTQLLFQRLTSAARHLDDISEIFKYELCSVPASLFDNNGFPREAKKSTLADTLWNDGNSCSDSFSEGMVYVIDGGSLIQKIPWVKGSTFHLICSQYREFIRKRYSKAVVVFDGYIDGPNTKDITHLRRNKGAVGTNVAFSFDTPFRSKKETFLNNSVNKQKFISMLSECLVADGVQVRQASEDADCLIVETAIELADQSNVTVVGEDTDVLVLLLFHVKQHHKSVIFRSDITRRVKPPKTWDINRTKAILGDELCYYLPFLHALTGCDTTSRIFGISKASAIKTFKNNVSFRCNSSLFVHATDKTDIVKTGEAVILALFGALPEEGLNSLRYRLFSSKTVSSTCSIQVQTLPPTSSAAALHCLRVYHQVQTWMGNSALDPLDYGWEMSGGLMMPVKSDIPPAPDSLLQVIRCKCKTGCDSKKCTCRKNGLECTIACGDCRGIACSNSPTIAECEIYDD